MGINGQNEALVPHVRMVTLLFVVLLSFLQGSVTTTIIETIEPHEAFEMRLDCPEMSSKTLPATNFVDCGEYMIFFNYGGFRYDKDVGECAFFTRNSYGKSSCWRRVPQN